MSWMKTSLGFYIGVFLWIGLASPVWAQDAGGAGSSTETSNDARREPAAKNFNSEDDDQYNFKWLDPDKKIYVLQNRKYQKAHKVLLSFLGGTDMTAPYRTVYSLSPRIAFYFTEEWGFEGFFNFRFNSQNDTFQQLAIASPNALPVVREIIYQTGLLVHWAPWYAKINFFNSILYFDWYFSAGVGMSGINLDRRQSISASPDIVHETRMTIFMGTGHQFHISEHWGARLDFTSSFYNAPNLGQTGDNTWFSNFNFYAGITARL